MKEAETIVAEVKAKGVRLVGFERVMNTPVIGDNSRFSPMRLAIAAQLE